MSPFWSIQQTKKTSAVNMELFKVSIDSPPVHPFPFKKVPQNKQPQYTVTFYCAKNSKRIKKGETLERSVMMESYSDSDSDRE